MTYKEAFQEACAKALQLNIDVGIHKNEYYKGGFAPPFSATCGEEP